MTRLYNALCAVASMRHAVSLATEYSKVREAFGKFLYDHPLHRETLECLEAECAGAFHLIFFLAGLLGKEELKTEHERSALRVLTPIAKLYTAKQAIRVVSEAIECFGGAGYIEDTRLPTLLRDTQVLSIWEGTTNVLSLDLLRALGKQGEWLATLQLFHEKLSGVTTTALNDAVRRTQAYWEDLHAFFDIIQGGSISTIETHARTLAYAIARAAIATLSIEHAAWCVEHLKEESFVTLAKRWCQKLSVPLQVPMITPLQG
jgi:hypothetical protein